MKKEIVFVVQSFKVKYHRHVIFVLVPRKSARAGKQRNVTLFELHFFLKNTFEFL